MDSANQLCFEDSISLNMKEEIEPLTLDMKDFHYVTGSTTDHRQLTNRDAPDQHPIGAIAKLEEELNKLKIKIVSNIELNEMLNRLGGF